MYLHQICVWRLFGRCCLTATCTNSTEHFRLKIQQTDIWMNTYTYNREIYYLIIFLVQFTIFVCLSVCHFIQGSLSHSQSNSISLSLLIWFWEKWCIKIWMWFWTVHPKLKIYEELWIYPACGLAKKITLLWWKHCHSRFTVVGW